MLLLTSVTTWALDYNEEIKTFFELFSTGKTVEAVDSIYRSNPWIQGAHDAVENLKTQLVGIERLVGNYNGNQKIGQIQIKDRFVHITYLVLFDRQPVRMEFEFYRPADDWMVYSFSFDDEFDEEVEQAARAQILDNLE
jgi:hypothetical protein